MGLQELVGRCGRVGVFIDGGNLAIMPTILFGQEGPERRVDFAKLKLFLAALGQLKTLNYYTARRYAEGVDSFFQFLESLDYLIIHLPTRTHRDGSQKGSVDSHLMFDAIQSLNRFDTMVLVSGDGDFAPLVEHLQDQGKKVVVLSARRSLSPKLARVADAVISLDELKEHLTYLPHDERRPIRTRNLVQTPTESKVHAESRGRF